VAFDAARWNATRADISITTIRHSRGAQQLNVRPTGFDADLANYRKRRRASSIPVSERGRCNGDGVPVCTPIGSKFSMEQTTTQLSIRSRMTSILQFFPADQRFFDQHFVNR
jgi:hypothetical protein